MKTVIDEQCFTCSVFFVQQPKTTERSEDIQDTLAAEWESFEKLIQAGQDERPKQEAAEQVDGSIWSSEFLKKPAPVESGHVTDRPFEVRPKRVFREVESDSDVNSNADSEDEARPAVGMNSKVDRQSSSSDSSPSPKNILGMKSASSDSDSSSDDEQPSKPTKVPLGKCDFSVHVSNEFL